MEIPVDLKHFFASTEAGEITPKEFLQALEGKEITGMTAIVCVSRAFNLRFEERRH